ncbi:MAG: IS66 family insertion sequence element accessory protein TnpB [Deltaproteobacteria bacterium]|nr:IS66 family insertion sequence element accessory protein TnpB [Deltaproteobacteria bacterium]
MRRGFYRLAELVKSEAKLNPLSGEAFVFLSRCRKRVKLLYWDKDGYAIWYKGLEAGAFRVENKDGYEEITGVDLRKLLSGIELNRINFSKNISEKVRI